MTFHGHARRARNEALPLGARRLAVKRCVSAYAPFGYRETLALLIRLHGPLNSGRALVAAVDTLEASRGAWRAAVTELAALRYTVRRSGRRPVEAEMRRREDAALGGWAWPGGLHTGGPRARLRAKRLVAVPFLVRHGVLTPQQGRYEQTVREIHGSGSADSLAGMTALGLGMVGICGTFGFIAVVDVGLLQAYAVAGATAAALTLLQFFLARKIRRRAARRLAAGSASPPPPLPWTSPSPPP
ncbi:hypothetical protein [Catellatospora citrea]|uniref:Uncharacterized protein n=1 Tax=Catellatospora citrea TaxID=53366 RepID=A0A8J3KFI4_9ACTN|nr:hypothetical protein [Catellatospora citrea]RKE09952.1 hypothetical protein C8E86_4846 [Catellatospora citrea]GIG02003.1 hypothetical protein Cci01nite_70960 [Catellatospora citrea]